MPIVSMSCDESKIYNLYASAKKPVFTLYVWSKCPHCPPFLANVEKVAKKHPSLRINLVRYDDNPTCVASITSSFPAMHKNVGKIIAFQQAPTEANLTAFFTSSQDEKREHRVAERFLAQTQEQAQTKQAS